VCDSSSGVGTDLYDVVVIASGAVARLDDPAYPPMADKRLFREHLWTLAQETVLTSGRCKAGLPIQ
jgi:hypothetical protein